jgi:hypothetical protein
MSGRALPNAGPEGAEEFGQRNPIPGERLMRVTPERIHRRGDLTPSVHGTHQIATQRRLATGKPISLGGSPGREAATGLAMRIGIWDVEIDGLPLVASHGLTRA